MNAFRTFENLTFKGLVVTNVEPEHVEHFGSEEELMRSFVTVSANVAGPVVACADDPGSLHVAKEAGSITYGTSPDADWRMVDVESVEAGMKFKLVGRSQETPVDLPIPGRHVARNAAGALALIAELGYDLEAGVEGIGKFRGIGRRWEHRGTVSGVMLVDDYAHHPTEVAATLEAARGVVPGRIWAVFQPHLFSRTERFQIEFGRALCAADVVLVTDVYGSREEPVPGVTGALVADAARECGGEVHYVRHKSDLAEFLLARVAPGDLILTMGAGDITLLPVELASRLAERSE